MAKPKTGNRISPPSGHRLVNAPKGLTSKHIRHLRALVLQYTSAAVARSSGIDVETLTRVLAGLSTRRSSATALIAWLYLQNTPQVFTGVCIGCGHRNTYKMKGGLT